MADDATQPKFDADAFSQHPESVQLKLLDVAASAMVNFERLVHREGMPRSMIPSRSVQAANEFLTAIYGNLVPGWAPRTLSTEMQPPKEAPNVEDLSQYREDVEKELEDPDPVPKNPRARASKPSRAPKRAHDSN